MNRQRNKQENLEFIEYSLGAEHCAKNFLALSYLSLASEVRTIFRILHVKNLRLREVK